MASLEIWLARWLRRRGWVVFWLDEPARSCRLALDGVLGVRVPGPHHGCWLALYEQQERP